MCMRTLLEHSSEQLRQSATRNTNTQQIGINGNHILFDPIHPVCVCVCAPNSRNILVILCQFFTGYKHVGSFMVFFLYCPSVLLWLYRATPESGMRGAVTSESGTRGSDLGEWDER